jgi:hypothetical protein
MTEKTDTVTLILRFVVGAFLGALFMIVAKIILIWFNIFVPARIFLALGVIVTLFSALSTTLWGDKFLMEFMKIFKIFKYFP